MKRLCLVSIAMFSAACGDDGGTTTQTDAPSGGGAVEAVTCPATPDAEVTTNDGSFSFSPATTTITANQTVKFVMSSTHDVKPNPAGGNTDSALVVNFGETKCYKFATAGEYNFKCNPHGFVGKIVVQ